MTTNTRASAQQALLTDDEIRSIWIEHGLDDEAVEDFARAIESALLSKLRAPVATLQWSEVAEPNEQVRYTHVLAESPLGRFSIEWKSWKPRDSYCVYLDGDYLHAAMNLNDAKAIALKKVADMAHSLAGYRAALASAHVAGKAQPDGYAYRYPSVEGTAIRFNHGGEVNGSRPIESIPYWLYAAPQASEAVRDAPECEPCSGMGIVDGMGDRCPSCDGSGLSAQPGAQMKGGSDAT